ncbi:MAG: STAS domain-containing protein [Phycisphaerales bacterium JB065]
MRETTHCTLEPTAGVLIVRLKGPGLSEQEVASVLSDLNADAPSQHWRIALDLTKVEFLASAGIGALINIHRSCSTGGGGLAMFGVNDNIEQVFKITKMNKFFTITKDQTKAIKKLV